MFLNRLSITGVRNLHPVILSNITRINIFYGLNGSGKTSLLEAIFLLGLGRSFRTGRIDTPITYQQPEYTVFGELSSKEKETGLNNTKLTLGLSRKRTGDCFIRINGQNVQTASTLAEVMPVQLINPDSFRFLEAGPKVRRQFLDWGVFHSEPRFFQAWKRMQRALHQRNSWLRHATLDKSQQEAWDHEFSLASLEVDTYRKAYLEMFRPVFEEVLAHLIDLKDLQLSYYQGWDKDRSLQTVLESSIQRDRAAGHTHAGPQRADLRIRISGLYDAVDVMSRGQQKLIICALRIAQGYLLSTQYKQAETAARKRCIYLIDDLPSELDSHHQKAICQLLEQSGCQIFITCINPASLKNCWMDTTSISTFHVKQGYISQQP